MSGRHFLGAATPPSLTLSRKPLFCLKGATKKRVESAFRELTLTHPFERVLKPTVEKEKQTGSADRESDLAAGGDNLFSWHFSLITSRTTSDRTKWIASSRPKLAYLPPSEASRRAPSHAAPSRSRAASPPQLQKAARIAERRCSPSAGQAASRTSRSPLPAVTMTTSTKRMWTIPRGSRSSPRTSASRK